MIRLLRFPSWNTDPSWWDLGLVGTGHPRGGPPRALVRDNPAAHEATSETRGWGGGRGLSQLRHLGKPLLLKVLCIVA